MSQIDLIRAEIERLKKEHQEPTFRGDEYEEGGVNGYQLALDKVLSFLDTLQEQPVDLEKEIDDKIRNVFFDLNGIAIAGSSAYASVEDMVYIVRYFYELGRQSKERPLDTSEDERIREEIKNFLDDICYLKASITPEDLDRDAISRWIAYLNRQSKEQHVKTNIVEDLKYYLSTTPKEQIEKDWESLKEWDKVGPSVSEFLGWKQPVCEELEEAVVDYFEGYWSGMETAEQCNTDLHFTPPAIMRLARHFYELGQQSKPKVCEELEEENIFANKDLNKEWKKFSEQENIESL